MRKLIVLWLCLCGGLVYAADGLREVTDSQGNKNKVDDKGIVYTDASPAPFRDRPHASVENVNYYYNKFGTLINGGEQSDAIFMGTEILDLPEDSKNIPALKYAVSLTMKRAMDIETLNRQVPFVRHERDGKVVYRNRQMQFEVGYPARFPADDQFAGNPGKMEFAYLAMALDKPGDDGMAPAIAITAQLMKTTLEDTVRTVQGNIQKKRGVELKLMKSALRAGGKQYKGSRTVNGKSVSEEALFLTHPKGRFVYTVSFMCGDARYNEYYPHFEAVVKSLRIGPIAPLKYRLEPPPGLLKEAAEKPKKK